MTRKEALQELLVKVRADLDTAHHHAAAFPSESAYGHCTWHDSHKASSGSMDAALSLFEAVLPGWKVGFITQTKIQWRVNISVNVDLRVNTKSETPSRALLIAILEALVVMEDE